MITVRSLLSALLPGLLVVVIGCSGGDDSSSSSTPAETEALDRQEITARLAETAERWHYGDKAILYDMEFDYLTEEFNYDEYLEMKKVSVMNSDTLEAFNVQDIQFYGRDSADVKVEIVFVGILMDTTKFFQTWKMFRHHDRWIRPTISNQIMQLVREEERRVADSASRAESNEDW